MPRSEHYEYDPAEIGRGTDRGELPQGTRRPDAPEESMITGTGLYLNDLLYYNQEELVRRFAPHYQQVDEDFGHDDNFPEDLDEDDLIDYYEPFD